MQPWGTPDGTEDKKDFYNLSNRILGEHELKLLCRGWKFCIEQKVTRTLDLKTDIEHGMYWIKKNNKKNKSIRWDQVYDEIKIE
ncbi:unnamed protein product [Didymodactylos carnosus]|uniref:Uncharacterized protein n=2 Tax=Didymodactylos carnosus TaxID=1234261 RepID=A0A815EUW4_9BILA|nr:unnamed protein product [Didymodactylos carnosus]CAF4159699.1 unnamed protein product [Didymodactylos carnosus]